jgi:phospholipid transport system substrate-binding protein
MSRHVIVARRIACLTLLAAALAFGPAPPRAGAAAVDDGAAARSAVQSIVDRALGILKRPDGAGREAAFLRLFRDDFATQAIGRFVLGSYRANVTPEQFGRYVGVLETLVAKTTAARLSGYAGESVALGDVRAEGSRWVVSSRVAPKGREAVTLDWVVARAGGKLKVVDLRVENLSLALTERDEFASVLQANGGDVEKLIDFMQDKIRRLDQGDESAIAPAPRTHSPPR